VQFAFCGRELIDVGVQVGVGVHVPDGDGADRRDEAVRRDICGGPHAQQGGQLAEFRGEDAEAIQGAARRAVDRRQRMGEDLLRRRNDPESATS